MVDPRILGKEKAELMRVLLNDGHDVEELRPEEWKTIVATARKISPDTMGVEKWFEKPLDTDLLAAFRCKACGRAFPLLAVTNDGTLINILVTDEEGDELVLTEEPPCLAKSAQTH